MALAPYLPSAGLNRFRFNGFALPHLSHGSDPGHPEVALNIE